MVRLRRVSCSGPGIARVRTADGFEYVDAAGRPVDDPDVWFVHELIGLPVVLSDGTEVGTCVSIVDNPAHDMVELDDGSLVPLVFVVDVGAAIEIDPPEGLLDLE